MIRMVKKKGRIILIIGGDSKTKAPLTINKKAVFEIINGKIIPRDIFIEIEKVKLDDRGLPILRNGKLVTEFIRRNIVSFKIGYIEEIKKKKPWKIA